MHCIKKIYYQYNLHRLVAMLNWQNDKIILGNGL